LVRLKAFAIRTIEQDERAFFGAFVSDYEVPSDPIKYMDVYKIRKIQYWKEVHRAMVGLLQTIHYATKSNANELCLKGFIQ